MGCVVPPFRIGTSRLALLYAKIDRATILDDASAIANRSTQFTDQAMDARVRNETAQIDCAIATSTRGRRGIAVTTSAPCAFGSLVNRPRKR
jgi:hypothetical protein